MWEFGFICNPCGTIENDNDYYNGWLSHNYLVKDLVWSIDMAPPSSIDLQEQRNSCELRRKLSSMNSAKSNRDNGRLSIVSKLVPKPSIVFSTASSSFSGSTASIAQHQLNLTLHVVKTIRWISAWDLWLYALKSEMKGYVSEFTLCNKSHQQAAKESLVMELQSLISGASASRNSQKDVRIMFHLIDIWEEVRREGVSVLSALQITGCEHKSELRRVRLDQLLKIELGQETIISKILFITRTMDSLYAELEDLVDKQIDTKCLPIGLDNNVAAALSRLRTRDQNQTAFSLPTEVIQKYLNSNNYKRVQASGALLQSSPFYNLPDFFEPLFVRRRIPVDATVVICPARYDRIIEIAIEWFMAWCLFGESIFDELSALSPEARTFYGQQGLLEKQIKQMNNILTDVQDIANQEANSWNVVMKSCLFVLESLTTLLEVTKHESSYLIHHLEKTMLALGATDLKEMPNNPAAARVYCIRNVVLSKDRALAASTEYLYDEISSLIDVVETKFHDYPGYSNEFGSLTARLMSKCTQRRKELLQSIQITVRSSEPEDSTVNQNDIDDKESTSKSLNGFEIDEARLVLTPETLKTESPISASLCESTESLNANVDSTSSLGSAEFVNIPLLSPAPSPANQPDEDITAAIESSRAETEDSGAFSSTESNENELPASVFGVDSCYDQSATHQDRPALKRPDRSATKSGVWKNLVKMLSFHKSAKK